jgi:cytochrome oxidase assembly protein ShyY1
MTSYRFARRPRWVLTHLFVLAVVVLMVNLGFWQLRRLDEKRDRNALIEDRIALPAAPVGQLVDPGDGKDVTDGVRFRSVTATGHYADEAPLTSRTTLDGLPGGWVFSVLDLDTGERVVVLRGFGHTATDGSVIAPRPPTGEVTVHGHAIPIDRVDRPARTDVRHVVDADGDALPVLVQASSSQPAEDDALQPVPLPALDEGPHFSYAVQWFLFSAVTVAGYPFLLRREARRRGPAGDDDETDDDGR